MKKEKNRNESVERKTKKKQVSFYAKKNETKSDFYSNLLMFVFLY